MSKTVFKDCIVDGSFAVVEPSLHDSNLIGLNLANDKKVVLSFALESGDLVKLYLDGVESFICGNLRKGNIVLDLTISSGTDADLEELNELFDVPKFENKKFHDFLDKLKSKVVQKDLSIVTLNPSYGCNLRALVESVKYEVVK
jgi:hypothetical protein